MEKTFDLQRFADDPAPADDVVPEAEDKAQPEPAPEAMVKPPKEAKYTDDDVNRLIDQKFAEWQRKQQRAVDEAKKLAEMNATERAQYERDRLQQELDEYKRLSSLSEMTKVARKMLAESGITVPDDLLSMLVTEDAKDTKAAVDGFAKLFSEAVEAAVKDRLKGTTPRRGTGGPGAPAPMTKEEIMAIKDPELRQQKMLEHKDLFNL